MTACCEDLRFAQKAWENMQKLGRWTPKHTTTVRTALGRVLAIHVPGLVAVINPLARTIRTTAFVTTTSHEGRFSLQDCLPMRVRRLSPWETDSALFQRLLEEFTCHLRSLSRGNLLKLAGWLDRLLWGTSPSSQRPVNPLWNNNQDDSVEHRWLVMQELGPRQWLQRYGAVTAPHSLCFTLFKRQVHWLRLLHSRVLHGHSTVGPSLLSIPTPRPSGRLRAAGGFVGYITGDGDLQCDQQPQSSGSSGLSASASHGSSGDDESHRHQRLELRDALFSLQEHVVRPDDPVMDASRQYSFTCTEVRSIVMAARSHLERLVVMLFLKTGLRLGGLSRLQLPSAANRPGPEDSVPEIFTTIEKNGRLRRVLLPPICRLLVCNWLYERGSSGGPWLFPSNKEGNGLRSMHKNTLWRVCRGVFQRAGLSGPHVHPHTFRHTVIKILYMNGIPFERIAKWIGHASATITSTTYHRLQEHELQQLVFHTHTKEQSNKNGQSNMQTEWQELSLFLDDPYRLKKVSPLENNNNGCQHMRP